MAEAENAETDRKTGQPETRAQKLSVCMPVYNEENTVEDVVRTILGADLPVTIELVVTDDASTDGTADVLSKLSSELPGRIHLATHAVNMGKSVSVSNCLKRATGDIIIVQDADLEYTPDDYGPVITPILEGKADVVYGARFIKGRPEGTPVSRYLANRALTIEFNIVHGSRINDMETCYKAFRKEVLPCLNIRSERFGMEPEITAKLLRAGYDIMEVPVSYKARPYSEGKKITAWDGIKAVGAILYFRFFD